MGTAVTVRSTDSVLVALKKMSDYGISSVAVVDASGRDGEVLIGNISMADIRFVMQATHGHSFHRLWMSCAKFVSVALQQKGIENSGKVDTT